MEHNIYLAIHLSIDSLLGITGFLDFVQRLVF
jgi:hypothetical protein